MHVLVRLAHPVESATPATKAVLPVRSMLSAIVGGTAARRTADAGRRLAGEPRRAALARGGARSSDESIFFASGALRDRETKLSTSVLLPKWTCI